MSQKNTKEAQAPLGSRFQDDTPIGVLPDGALNIVGDDDDKNPVLGEGGLREIALNQPGLHSPITPKEVRYIKLGSGGRWEKASIEHSQLHFGHRDIPHELALSGKRELIIAQQQLQHGKTGRVAADDAREILDFYHLGTDCLWVTIARDHLWWTFAEPQVSWTGDQSGNGGQRIRQCIGGWCNTDISGRPLRLDTLSTKLTKVAAYRRTICTVEARDYLLRRINGIIEPIVSRNNQARDALLGVLIDAIKSLHETDFETLADVVFARSGWYRASAIGGTMKLVDLVLQQATTDERAAVQVKSEATQKILDEYIANVDDAGTFDRAFFICHSPKGTLSAPSGRRDIHVWYGRAFAETVLRLGLSDWVVERAC
jgi:hypothetical protein